LKTLWFFNFILMKPFTIFLLFLVSFFSISAFAQKTSYADWQVEAGKSPNLLPKYGDVERTAAQKKADSTLIRTALAEKTTPREASDYFVQLGFSLLAKGDQKTAMQRFNQAWLIDSKNENVFWGFGGVYFSFGDHEKALAQYTEGLVLNPKNANIMVDMATIGMARFNNSKDTNELVSSLNLLKIAYEIDPTNQTLLFKLSICYFFNNDCPHAIRYFEECMKLGGKSIPENYKNALLAKCKG
jgi:tetratricopeptide (TPR) repeat protein